ncbi:MAG: EAL domain-containing protein [Myxococcota bacterium]
MEGTSQNFAEWFHDNEQSSVRSVSGVAQIPDVLNVGELFTVYQPLVDFDTGEVFAFEAVVRSTSEYFINPPELFAQAIKTQYCGALGRMIRQLAVRGCSSYPLFLNVHPHEFNEGWLVRPDDPIFTHECGIYLEVTESVPLSHAAECHSVLRELRHKGIQVAVDDLGAGYSNLKYIADLAPDVVKLDRELIVNVGIDRRLRMLVTSLVRLCENMEAKVVAEGIEDLEELQVLRDIGVHYGQGYFLARPDSTPPMLSLDPLGTPHRRSW